ncbi:MAG: glucosyltransferase domain-containing protein [Cyanobacteriota bacterium]
MPEFSPKSANESFVDWLADLVKRTGLTANAAISLFIFAVISMGGFMFFHSISIDEELSFFQEDPWNLAYQGRFLLAAYFAIAKGILPLFPYLILAASYVAAYILILGLHGLRTSWRTHLAYLIFILFPTNWLSQEFSGIAGVFGIGLLATCLAATLTDAKLHAPQAMPAWRRISPAAILLLLIAISGFQSLITPYLAIGAGTTLFKQHPEGQPAMRQRVSLQTKLMAWLIPAIAAAGLHTLLFKLLLRLHQVEPRHIGIYFKSPYFMLRTEPAAYIFGNIEQFLRTYFTPGFFYGQTLFALPLLLVGGLCLVLWMRRQPAKRAIADAVLMKGWPAVLTTLLLLCAPLLLNIISKPYRIPMRAFMALPYVAWLASILWMELAAKAKLRSWLFAGTLLSALLVCQSLLTVSQYYGARAFNFRADQLVASSIVSSMVQHRSVAKPGPVTYLASHGELKRVVPYGTGWYSVAGGSFFNWDHGNDARMVAWLRTLGVEGLKPLEEKQVGALEPVFKTMQAWPSPDSIRVEGNSVLVKLSE